MKLFFFLFIFILTGCSILSKPITLEDPKKAMIQVMVQFPDGSKYSYTMTNFSIMQDLLNELDCKLCNMSQLNPLTILKDGDLIVLSSVPGLSVSINQATREELMFLPGIGERLAHHIIDYRTNFGLFQRLEDLMRIKGIKKILFNKIKAYISL